jgi:hypothetical protein
MEAASAVVIRTPSTIRRLARTWDPTASAKIRPTSVRIWLAVKPASDNTEPIVNLPTVHLLVARAPHRAICHIQRWTRRAR